MKQKLQARSLRRLKAAAVALLVGVTFRSLGGAEAFTPIRQQLSNEITQLETTNHLTRTGQRALRTMRLTMTLLETSPQDERTLCRVTQRLSHRRFPTYEQPFLETAGALTAALQEEIRALTNLTFELPPSNLSAAALRRTEKLLQAFVRQEATTNVWRRATLLYRARVAFQLAASATQRAVPQPAGDANLSSRLRFRWDHSYVSNAEEFRWLGDLSQLFVDSGWQRRSISAWRTPTNVILDFFCQSLQSTAVWGSAEVSPGHYQVPSPHSRVTLMYRWLNSDWWSTRTGSWYVFTNLTHAWGVILAEGELAVQGEFSVRLEPPPGN